MSAQVRGGAPAPARAPRSAVRRTLRMGRTRLGLSLAAVVVLTAVLGPLLAPHDPAEFIGSPFQAPGPGSVLGTDALGRDVLTRVLHGGWTVLWMSLASATLGTVLGAAVGMVAAYGRGLLDEMLMRCADVVLSLPLLVFVLLFVSLFGTSPWLIVLLVGVAHAPQVARVTRAVAADVREREFVLSAEALGAPRWRILTSEVLPNITTPLMVEYGLRIVWSIAGIAGLSFLGLGIQPPTADWGLMINENRTGLSVQPWGVLAPLLLIGGYALAANLVTDGISRSVAGEGDSG